jgi:putative membrane protein
MMTAVMLSQMFHDRDDHMGRGWWWAMGIGWLIFLALLVVVTVVLVRHYTQRNPTQQRAEDILAERFARGEIDDDEYRKRRDALRG